MSSLSLSGVSGAVALIVAGLAALAAGSSLAADTGTAAAARCGGEVCDAGSASELDHSNEADSLRMSMLQHGLRSSSQAAVPKHSVSTSVQEWVEYPGRQCGDVNGKPYFGDVDKCKNQCSRLGDCSVIATDQPALYSFGPSKTCEDYDVALGPTGTPFIFNTGQFRPICGHSFWENQNGATIFCRQLGYTSGTIEVANGNYPENAVFVNACPSANGQTLKSCGGKTGSLNYPPGKCNTGFGDGAARIKCAGPSTLRQSCVDKPRCYFSPSATIEQCTTLGGYLREWRTYMLKTYSLVQVKNIRSGLCLDTSADGTLIMSGCQTGYPGQQWYQGEKGSLVSKASRLCLTMPEQLEPGVMGEDVLLLATCTARPWQQWKMSANTDTAIRSVGQILEACLDEKIYNERGTVAEHRLRLSACTGEISQKWRTL